MGRLALFGPMPPTWHLSCLQGGSAALAGLIRKEFGGMPECRASMAQLLSEVDRLFQGQELRIGFGRIVALYHHSSTYNRFTKRIGTSLSGATLRPNPRSGWRPSAAVLRWLQPGCHDRDGCHAVPGGGASHGR